MIPNSAEILEAMLEYVKETGANKIFLADIGGHVYWYRPLD